MVLYVCPLSERADVENDHAGGRGSVRRYTVTSSFGRQDTVARPSHLPALDYYCALDSTDGFN